MTDETKHENATGHSGYERQDLQASTILYFLLAIVIATAICVIGLRGLFVYLNHREKASEPPVNPLVTNVPADTRHLPADSKEYLKENFPNPRLEVDERTQLDDDRLREEKTLYSYGWVDEKAGTVHIPIDRAMELIVHRGLPVRSQAEANASPATMTATNKTATSKAGIGKKGEKK
jgi:hypothetical protein